jgi:hypothetical protein
MLIGEDGDQGEVNGFFLSNDDLGGLEPEPLLVHRSNRS